MKMDAPRLPKTALVDTGVFMRFLGERPDDPRSPACKAFCMALLANKHELFVAAPTIAEIVRWKSQPIPRVKGITVVPFDDRAAVQLGLNGPDSLITQLIAKTGLPRNYIKYDFMIASCAIRAGTEVLIAIDGDFLSIGKHFGLSIKRPEDYAAPEPLRLEMQPCADMPPPRQMAAREIALSASAPRQQAAEPQQSYGQPKPTEP